MPRMSREEREEGYKEIKRRKESRRDETYGEIFRNMMDGLFQAQANVEKLVGGGHAGRLFFQAEAKILEAIRMTKYAIQHRQDNDGTFSSDDNY